MPQDYYSIITNNGLIKEAQAGQIGGSPINLTEIAVGDGGGSYYEPDSEATGLVNELFRANLTSSVLDANNPNQLIIEGVIPEEAGPFHIREVGIFDSDGDLFAIGKYPETFKSNFASGSGKRLYIRMIIGFVSTPNVEIMISENINFDPNFESNLNDELDNINNELDDRLKISQDLADLNDAVTARGNLGLGSAAVAGDATENDKGIAQIASTTEVNEGTDNEKIVTPLGLKSSVVNVMNLIATANASNVFSIVFNNLDNTYSSYKIVFENVAPVNHGVQLKMRVSTDNGVSFKTGASDYGFSIWCTTDIGEQAVSGAFNSGYMAITMTHSGFQPSNNAIGVSGELNIPNPARTSGRKPFYGIGTYQVSGADRTCHIGIGGRYKGSNSAINAVQFYFNTGNISSGKMKLYGIK